MPIYEYRCTHCEKEFEKYVSGPATAVACPVCASSNVMRKLSVFGLRAAGSFTPSSTMSTGGCCGGGPGCHWHRPPPPPAPHWPAPPPAPCDGGPAAGRLSRRRRPLPAPTD